ncbi:acyl-CoA thioesterase [Azoarcus taiwanensis]|uniref:Acyl-CoA thioesterase n=1 Tax=Azoarcus taiwanensis TaxID=666964 RepID=A0A972FE63_9RHOO|nr:thioesterase family protein [Azoarcus taiwanensis]NMG03843.1 acyl-CoA thioesterase [Azoarcus taiwanensis]
MTRLKAEVLVVVPFHDVDVMGVTWHGHYIKYFEAARAALLRSIDYDYPQMQESGYLWPVVECQLKYVGPARYGQTLRVSAELLEHENRLKIAYRIFDAASDTCLTRGFTTQVAVDAVTNELQFVSPAALLRRVESRQP